MLALRPSCECCDKDLAPDAPDAMICTFECTFCADCVANRLPGGRCPNCGVRVGAPTHSPSALTHEISGLHRARRQGARRMRQGRLIPLPTQTRCTADRGASAAYRDRGAGY